LPTLDSGGEAAPDFGPNLFKRASERRLAAPQRIEAASLDSRGAPIVAPLTIFFGFDRDARRATPMSGHGCAFGTTHTEAAAGEAGAAAAESVEFHLENSRAS
jgi:hypothetical protein